MPKFQNFPPFKPITSLEIQQEYFKDMYDFHTVGIVSLHKGLPLAGLADLSSLKHLPFQNETVQLDRTQINSHLECLRGLVAKL